MIKRILFIFALLLGLLAKAQNWAPVGGGLNNFVWSVIYDSIHDKLLVSGNLLTKSGNIPTRGVASWNGMKWDSLAGGVNTHDKAINPNNPNGTIVCGIPYNGKLLVGGVFESVGGIYANALATWDGVKWDSLPKRAFRKPGDLVNILYKKNNIIYIGGVFDTIAGLPAKSLGTWDGTNFQPVNYPPQNFYDIKSIIEYKNELYFAGSFYDNADTLSRIIRYDGAKWRSVGGGFHGSVAYVNTMAIYNNDLYIGGWFRHSSGNIGENVVKWDGNQFTDVGFGTANGEVKNLIVHNNKLWAIGNYSIASFMPALWGVSVYDGTKWCLPQDTINAGCFGAALYKDTIYIGGNFRTAQGDTNAKYVVKLKNETLLGQCNSIGINESNGIKNSISVYPNPVSNTLHIESEQYFETGTEIEITNCLGQIVLKLQYKNEIDVSQLSNGCYILKITTSDKQQFHSKFIKE